MKELINLARGFVQQFECALVYGIANVAQLDNLFKVNAKQFVIIEADPSVFSKLEEWHLALPEMAPKVSCFHVALSSEDAPTALLHQSSQSGFSSTAKPNQIKRFRPGLTFSSVSVPAKKLSYFTDKYAIAADQHNIALLNCNGAEHEILRDSSSRQFSSVIVKTTTKPLFGEQNQVSGISFGNGYSGCAIRSLQPATLNYILLRAPEWHVQKRELVKVQAGNKELESLNTDCNQKIDAEKETSDKLKASLGYAERELDSIKQQLGDSVEQITQLKKERDSEAHWHAEHKKWAEGLQAEKSAIESKLHLQIEVEKKCQCDLEKQELLNEKMRESRNSLEISIRLLSRQNSKLQIDLDELRRKYEDNLESEKMLTELLRELHVKLQKAATFYNELDKQYPELSLSLEDI